MYFFKLNNQKPTNTHTNKQTPAMVNKKDTHKSKKEREREINPNVQYSQNSNQNFFRNEEKQPTTSEMYYTF